MNEVEETHKERVREHSALLAMEKFGGSFASRLASAWFAADAENRRRLRSVFGHLIDCYADVCYADVS